MVRFYVKSILLNSKHQIMPFWQFHGLWILISVIFSTVFNAEISKINIQNPKWFKLLVFEDSNSQKLISRKIWLTENFWNFTLCSCTDLKNINLFFPASTHYMMMHNKKEPTFFNGNFLLGIKISKFSNFWKKNSNNEIFY